MNKTVGFPISYKEHENRRALLPADAENIAHRDQVYVETGYGDVLGKRDCQEVVKRYKKKGISVITAGIDDCANDIKSLYVDGINPKDAAKFLDYSDMTQLPKAFATIIKKELL